MQTLLTFSLRNEQLDSHSHLNPIGYIILNKKSMRLLSFTKLPVLEVTTMYELFLHILHLLVSFLFLKTWPLVSFSTSICHLNFSFNTYPSDNLTNAHKYKNALYQAFFSNFFQSKIVRNGNCSIRRNKSLGHMAPLQLTGERCSSIQELPNYICQQQYNFHCLVQYTTICCNTEQVFVQCGVNLYAICCIKIVCDILHLGELYI